MQKNRFWILCFLALALLSLLALLLLPLLQKPGRTVCVYQDGALLRRLPLNADAREEIVCDGGRNIVEIQDGAVRITWADCPDQICVRHAPVSQTADPIVCLPHRLVVSVEEAAP